MDNQNRENIVEPNLDVPGPLDFYFSRLASGDAAVELHFSSYFGELLSRKLRVRVRSPQLAEDIRQETLLRVLQIVRKEGVQHPEHFGALVSAVCNNVQMELVRGEMRHEESESEFEAADDTIDLDAPLVNQQRRRQVDTVLNELPQKDRDLLRMFFIEERDKAELCRRFDVGENYLRVLLHRAKSRFRTLFTKQFTTGRRSDPENLRHQSRTIGLGRSAGAATEEADDPEQQLLARYHELVDRKFAQELSRQEALELRRLGKELDSRENPKLLEDLDAGTHKDRELLRKSIDEILQFARQLKAE